jgi:predicted neuraminidase
VGIGEVPGFRPDEPIFWSLPDKTLFALYRDNSGLRRLFHSTSTDQGQTWNTPVPTNFPNATSKLFSLQTSRGYRVLISNANPQIGRRELHLTISEDGRSFSRMALLSIPSPPTVDSVSRIWHKFRTGVASLQYPHAIEHHQHLLIAFSRNKKQIELLRIPLDAIDDLLEN